MTNAYYPPPAVVKIRSCRIASAPNCAGSDVPDPYNVIFRGTRCVECIKHSFNERRRGDDTLKRKRYLSTKQYKLSKKLEKLTEELQELTATTLVGAHTQGASSHSSASPPTSSAGTDTTMTSATLASRLVQLGQSMQKCQQDLTTTNSELDGLRVGRAVVSQLSV